MIRAGVISAVVHVLTLLVAHHGVAMTGAFIGGLIAFSWEWMLALLAIALAFVLWLLLGTAALASMGTAAAVAVVVAGVVGLQAVESVGAKAPGEKGPKPEKPVEVAMVRPPDPVKDVKKDVNDPTPVQPPKPTASPSFSPNFASALEEGMKKAGESKKGKLWTVQLSMALPSAAEKTAEDGLARKALSAGVDSPVKSSEDAVASERVQDGTVSAAMDTLVDAMPRLQPLRQAVAAANAGARPMRKARAPKTAEKPAVPKAGSEGPAQADKTAAARIETKAKEGYAHAQFTLAEQKLLTRDPAEARAAERLLERAAIGGYTPAQMLLAVMAAEKGDPAKAHAWLDTAARDGNQAAKRAQKMLEPALNGAQKAAAETRRRKLARLMAMVAPNSGSGGTKRQVNESLRHAAVLGDMEAVHVLLAKNADADDADTEGRTPLIEAAWRGYPGIVRALVDAGARLDAVDTEGKDAIAWAAINGHARVVASLIAAGATSNQADHDGFTPLMRAAWNGHTATVGVLLRGGAQTQARNRFGRSALDYARSSGNRQILRLLAGQ